MTYAATRTFLPAAPLPLQAKAMLRAALAELQLALPSSPGTSSKLTPASHEPRRCLQQPPRRLLLAECQPWPRGWCRARRTKPHTTPCCRDAGEVFTQHDPMLRHEQLPQHRSCCKCLAPAPPAFPAPTRGVFQAPARGISPAQPAHRSLDQRHGRAPARAGAEGAGACQNPGTGSRLP